MSNRLFSWDVSSRSQALVMQRDLIQCAQALGAVGTGEEQLPVLTESSHTLHSIVCSRELQEELMARRRFELFTYFADGYCQALRNVL